MLVCLGKLWLLIVAWAHEVSKEQTATQLTIVEQHPKSARVALDANFMSGFVNGWSTKRFHWTN